MKYVILLLTLLVLCGFRGIETCETRRPNSITIFPVCGDSSLWIHQRFQRDSFLFEDIYHYRQRSISTRVWFNTTGLPAQVLYSADFRPDSVIVSEFIYMGGKLVRTRESRPEGLTDSRTFRLNDSLKFETQYFFNGIAQQFRIMNGLCNVSGLDFELRNNIIWKGVYEPILVSAGRYSGPPVPNPPTVQQVKCGEATGVWKRIDAKGKAIDSVDMTGTSAESASSVWISQQDGK